MKTACSSRLGSGKFSGTFLIFFPEERNIPSVSMCPLSIGRHIHYHNTYLLKVHFGTPEGLKA